MFKPCDMDIPMVEITTNGDAGHWGITDLYEYVAQKIEKLLASGEPFDTGWVGSKKETDYMRIIADREAIYVTASVGVDSCEDNAYIYDACPTEKDEELIEPYLDLIYDQLIEAGYREYCESDEAKLPRDASLDDVLDVVSNLRDECDIYQQDMFTRAKEIVAEWIELIKEGEQYTPSSTAGDYSPSNPWGAPGMSVSDFI